MSGSQAGGRVPGAGPQWHCHQLLSACPWSVPAVGMAAARLRQIRAPHVCPFVVVGLR